MADPALGLKMKLEVDDSSIPADIARAKRKVEAAGAATSEAPLAMPEGAESYGQMLERKRVELIKAERAKNEDIRAEQDRINELLAQDVEEHEARMARQRRKAREQQIAEERAAAAQRAESAAMRNIGLETGGATPGAINARTAAYARMDESLKGVRKRFTESAQEAGKWLGVAGAIGATATTFYALGNAIREGIIEYLKIGTERAADFKQALDLSDVQGSLKAYNDNLAELDAMMAERTAGSIRGWASSMLKSDEELQKEITQKRKDRDALQKVQDAGRRRDERIKEKADAEAKAKEQAETKRREQIAQRKQEAEDGKRFGEEAFQTEQDNLINSLDERARIVAESARKRNELEDKFNSLTFQQQDKNQEAYDRARDALILERNRRLREFDQQQIESAQEAATKVREAWSNAYRAIREESNRAFATDQAASMVQFAQQMRIEGMVATASMNRIVVEGVG